MPATGTGPATVAGAGQQLFHRGIPPCAKAHGCSTKPFEEVWGKELLSWLASLIFLSQVAHRCLMLFVEGGDQGSWAAVETVDFLLKTTLKLSPTSKIEGICGELDCSACALRGRQGLRGHWQPLSQRLVGSPDPLLRGGSLVCSCD